MASTRNPWQWRYGLPLLGLLVVGLIWWAGSALLTLRTPIAHAFAPLPSLQAFVELLRGQEIWLHICYSLERVGVGLVLGIVFGVPLGVATGLWRGFAQASGPVFQLL